MPVNLIEMFIFDEIKKMPFFSIIVPVFNVEQYLKECLDSILNQSYKDFELILVNDGSMDKSLEICEKYAELDSRVILINQPNEGVSAARNKGIELAKGKYIWFVDSDDYILEDSLLELYDELEPSGVDVLGFGSIHLYDDTQYRRRNPIYKDASYFSLHEFLSNQQIEIVPWIYIIRLEFLKENSLFFREDIKIHEDNFFVLEMFLKARKFITSESCYYVHRLRKNSLMRSNRDSDKLYALKELLFLYEKLKHQFKKKDFWAEQTYTLKNKFYKLYFSMECDVREKIVSKKDWSRILQIKFQLVKNDVLGIKMMKILHNFYFKGYLKKIIN